MSKFWGGVAVLILTALLFLVVPAVAEPDITVRDLEAECRYDRGTQSDIIYNRDRSFSFQGHFPVRSPKTSLDYDYDASSDEITLNIRTTRQDPPRADYVRDCRGLAVYNLRTDSLDEGRYTVTVKHNGEVQKRNVYRVR